MLSPILALLWLGPAPIPARAQATLDSWANARVVSLRLSESHPTAEVAYDPRVVEVIEAELDQARLAAGALDPAAAKARLDRARKSLLRHSELPQGAWLLAEVYAQEAALLERQAESPPSEAARSELAARASKLRAMAGALEGPRARELTQRAETDELQPRLSVAIIGLSPGDELEHNGVLAPRSIDALPGPQHFRVLRAGRLYWSGFVSVAPGQEELTLPLPAPRSCSLEELTQARIQNGRVLVEGTVSCAHWAVAEPASGQGESAIRIASCRKSSCGPLLTFRPSTRRPLSPPVQPPGVSGFPAWAAVLASVGGAALTGIVLWQAGVFDEEPAPERRWVFEGVRNGEP